MRRTGILVAMVAALALAGAMAAVLATRGSSSGTGGAAASEYRGSLVDPPKDAPALRLPDVSGRVVDLADYRGRPVLVTFIFANCPDICPRTVDKIRVAQDRMPAAQARAMRVVAVSVDPAGDTPAAVRRFIRAHRMQGRMDFLLGDRAALEPIWAAWGVAVAPREDAPSLVVHSGTTFGLDASGRIRTLYSQAFTPADIAADVPRLARAS